MNYPAPASTETVIEVLSECLTGVRNGDTHEGFVQFSLPYPPEDPADADFMLIARFRAGNLFGQGSLRTFGHLEPVQSKDTRILELEETLQRIAMARDIDAEWRNLAWKMLVREDHDAA